VCCEGLPCREGGGWSDRRHLYILIVYDASMHFRVLGAPRSARPCHKNATTNTPGTKSHSRGAGRGAARLLRGGDTVPECTVCQAATTGGVPANCAVQPSIPYALTTRLYINPTVSETDELPATWTHLLLAHGLIRHHSTKQLPRF